MDAAKSVTANFTLSVTGFDSQFNGSADGWFTVKGAWKISSGKYLSSVGVAKKYASVMHVGTYENFTYTVKMKRSGVCTSTACASGIIIRGNPVLLNTYGDWKPSYTFNYTNDGYVSVWKVSSGGKYIALKKWAYSGYVNRKTYWNTLKVVANGKSLKFYINTKLIWSGSDTTLTTGNVGFQFGRDGSAGTLLVDSATLTPISGSTSLDVPEEVAPGDEASSRDAYPSP
jgi:hypothetical protein